MYAVLTVGDLLHSFVTSRWRLWLVQEVAGKPLLFGVKTNVKEFKVASVAMKTYGNIIWLKKCYT